MEIKHLDNEIIINADRINILTVSDLHLRASNFKGRKDYPSEVLGYLENIRDIVYTDDINILLLYGDIFDNHFKEDSALQYFNKVSKIFKDIAEKCLIVTLMGNHDLHNYRSTPFFSITNIASKRINTDLSHLLFKPTTLIPLLNAPDRLIINDNVVIELFHFSDLNKNYKVIPDTKYKYIGIFHDALISAKASSYIKKTVGEIVYNAMCDHMTKIDADDSMFNYLDYACIGDIHTRVGEFKVGECIVDMPGTVGRTQYTILQGHTVVDLPLFTIEGSTIAKKHKQFPLLDIGDSYKVNMLEATKANRIESKQFKKALEKITFTKDIRKDIESADISDEVKVILNSALDNSNTINSISMLNEFIDSKEG